MRKLLAVVSCFTLGVVAAHWWPSNWHPLWLLCTLALTFVFRKQALLGMAVTCGLFYAASYNAYTAPQLDAYVDKEVTLQGQVLTDPVLKNDNWRFEMKLTGILEKHNWVPVDEKVVVSLKSKSPSATPDGRKPIIYGDSLLLQAVPLEIPLPPNNPGAFDAESFYNRQGIFYTLSLNPEQVQVLAHDDRGFTGRLFLPLREKLIGVLRAHFSHQHQAVLAGLVFGIVDEIDPEVLQTFRWLGVSHILAVSGANVALLIFPLLFATRKLGLSTRKRYTLAILVVLLYAGITGAEPSVVRAAAMAIVWCLARIVSRDSDPLTSWGIALLFALLLHPPVWQDVGFQLTMILTLGLLLLPERVEPYLLKLPLPATIRKALLFTLTAQILSVPLVLTINPAFTPLSLLANLYLVPLLSLLVPLAVLTVLLGLLHPFLAVLPAQIVGLLLDLLLHPLLYAGQSRLGLRNYQAPAPWWLVGYYTAWLVYALKPTTARRHMARRLSLILLTALLLTTHAYHHLKPQSLRITFLDVGQGDSILIQTPAGQTILIDGGGIPGFLQSTYDVGEQTVVPALASYGIDEIDLLVMTHPDEDHVRGLHAVLANFPIKKALGSAPHAAEDQPFYAELLRTLHQKGTPLHTPKRGDQMLLEPDLLLRFHNPPDPPAVNTRSDSNANSIAFTLHYRQRTFFFAADIEGEVEANLQDVPNLDVLKVAHHGSAHSTTAAFLRRTAPLHAVISAGRNNRYGHPAPATLERLSTAGAHIWRTDQQGAIRAETDGYDLHMISWSGLHTKRRTTPPSWQRNPIRKGGISSWRTIATATESKYPAHGTHWIT